MSGAGRRWFGQAASLLGLGALTLVVVGTAAAGARARGLLIATRADVYQRLALADLELRLSPVEPGVLARTTLPAGVRAAEERGLAVGRVEGPGLAPLAALLRRLPPEPPQVDRLEVRPGGRYPRPGEAALLVERSLADVNGVRVGDVLSVTVGGEQRALPVVGVALSPEHLLAPVHPAAPLPLKGSAGAVFVSAGAAAGLPRMGRVNSIRVRLSQGADPAAVEAALVAALPEPVREAIPTAREPGRQLSDMLLEQYGVYLPAIVGNFAVVGLLLLSLVVARGVDRRRREVGLRLALGQRARRVASALATPALTAVALGALAGVLLHGPVARAVATTWASSMGFPALIDPYVPVRVLLGATGACLLTAALASLLPTLWLLRRSPSALLHETALSASSSGRAVRWAGRLAGVLRLPPPLALALAGVTRRRRETLGAVLGVGLAVALVLTFSAVHASHRVEAEAAVLRATHAALTTWEGPVDAATVEALGRAVEGRAEPLVGGPVRLGAGRSASGRTLVGAPVKSVLAALPLTAGRAPQDDDAPEALVDPWMAQAEGLVLGTRLTLFPDPDAPEGVEVTVVGLLDGMSVGRLLVPIGTARRLYGLEGRATGALLDSPLPDAELAAHLDRLGDLSSYFTREQGLSQLDAAFHGSLDVLLLAFGTALGVALLILTILAVQDARDRAPEAALLDALGWRGRSLMAVAVGEVLARGLLALLLAGLLAVPLAGVFLERVEAVNGYRVALHVPWGAWAAILVPAALLLPLAALPTLLRARGAPAPLLRSLTPE